MSQENVEIVRAVMEAFNRRDFDAFLNSWAPEGQLDWSRAVGPINGMFGFDEMRSFWDELFDPWESTRFEIDELIDAGERVMAKHMAYLSGRDEIEVRARVIQVWTIRGGKAVRVCLYQDEQEALKAAGLSE
jgi:ketosteroid isomerase-like protein